MDPDAINKILDDGFDSFSDDYSSDEYLQPGMQESNHTSSDSDNISNIALVLKMLSGGTIKIEYLIFFSLLAIQVFSVIY